MQIILAANNKLLDILKFVMKFKSGRFFLKFLMEVNFPTILKFVCNYQP